MHGPSRLKHNGHVQRCEGNILLSIISVSLFLGTLMPVYGHPNKEEVHVSMLFLSADTPARLKTMGFTSMASDLNLCYICPVKGPSLVTAECFDLDSKFCSQLLDLTL